MLSFYSAPSRNWCCCCCCLFYRAYKLNFAILLLQVNNNNNNNNQQSKASIQQPTHIHSKHNKIIPEKKSLLLFLCRFFFLLLLFVLLCCVCVMLQSKDDKLWINWSVFICNLYFSTTSTKETRNNGGFYVCSFPWWSSWSSGRQLSAFLFQTIKQRREQKLEALIIYLQLYCFDFELPFEWIFSRTLQDFCVPYCYFLCAVFSTFLQFSRGIYAKKRENPQDWFFKEKKNKKKKKSSILFKFFFFFSNCDLPKISFLLITKKKSNNFKLSKWLIIERRCGFFFFFFFFNQAKHTGFFEGGGGKGLKQWCCSLAQCYFYFFLRSVKSTLNECLPNNSINEITFLLLLLRTRNPLFFLLFPLFF